MPESTTWSQLIAAYDQAFQEQRTLVKVRLGRRQLEALFGTLRPARLGATAIEPVAAEDHFEAVLE